MTTEAQKNVMVAAIIIGTIVFIIVAFTLMNAVQGSAVAPKVASTIATAKPIVTLSEITATKDRSYEHYTLSGSVKNNGYDDVKVFGTIDVYDCSYSKNGVNYISGSCDSIKVDSIPFGANPDAGGSATFEMGTKYGGRSEMKDGTYAGLYRYEARIDKIYKI